jgi:hypothetical protein
MSNDMPKVAHTINVLFGLLDLDAPLSAGLDPSKRSGPPHLYARPTLPGECAECGAPDSSYAKRWSLEARCKACVARWPELAKGE